MLNRRDFIKLSAITAEVLLVGCAPRRNKTNTAQTNSTGLLINQTLAIPTLINPTADSNGVKQYNLNINSTTHNFYADNSTNTFGINQSYLGNTLLMKDTDKVSINYTNNLNETTTMHGHGMHVQASQDGGVHQKIEPNNTWSAVYTVNQKACTNWYHPHLMGKTAQHVYKGLAGLIIIEDSTTNSLALPNTYGEDDIPLVIQDRQFLNYQLDYNPGMRDIMRGYRGDTLITNGQISPKFTAKSGLLRLRILNGSNASMYKFYFNDNRAFHQISTDNGFLQKPVSLTSLTLSPSERAEIVVGLYNDGGKEVLLKVSETIDNKLKQSTALSISVDVQSASVLTLPSSLITHEDIDISSVVRTRNFTLQGKGNRGNPSLTINNKSMDMARIDETIKVNELEIWNIKNEMGMDHNFHIHATHFIPHKRYTSSGTEYAISSNEQGYKDCIHIPPNESIDILVKMTDYTDPNGKYMYHCHFLEHEDAGMMGQFVVTT
jgi:FtsP/CotA-like multicopper oxidase with cupredoxin domain